MGVPLVASLVGVGGWRLPFAVVGTLALGLWLGVWGGFPRRPPSQHPSLAFFAHYREVGSHAMVWYVLGANLCQQIVFISMFGYLAAKKILVLASAFAGDWPPLAAVTVGLHQAGHALQCFGDPAIAQDFASAGIAVEVILAEDPFGTFTAR